VLKGKGKNFIRALGWSVVQSAVKVVSNFTIGKLVALWFGPAGLAVVGQFQNLFFLQQSATGGAVQNGVIQGVAHSESDTEQQKLVIESGAAITLLLTLIFAAVWVFGSVWIREHWLSEDFPPLVYYFLPIALVFSSAFFLISGYFSALKNYSQNAVINIIQSVATVAFFVVFGKIWGIYGACFGLLLGQFPAVVWGIKSFRSNLSVRIQLRWPKKKEDGMWNFALLALYSAIATQLNQLLIRTHITHEFSEVQAGFWEALQRISNLWVPVVSVLFTSLFLPRLSQRKLRGEFLKDTFLTVVAAGGLVFIFSVAVFGIKEWLMEWLFSKEFTSAKNLLGIHLLGDVLKAMTWSFAYALLSRKKSIGLLVIDLGFNLLYYGLVTFLMRNGDWSGAVLAYPLAMLVNLCVTIGVWAVILTNQPISHE
jgi:PST family polysaccharide transporter